MKQTKMVNFLLTLMISLFPGEFPVIPECLFRGSTVYKKDLDSRSEAPRE